MTWWPWPPKKKVNVYFTTNFSFRLSDAFLRRMVTSGLKACVVALDGFSQESYGRTRIGGKFELVKSNLERLLAIRRQLKSPTPLVEVQSCLFEHNRHEKPLIQNFCRRIGVDSLFFSAGVWGKTWDTVDAPAYTPRPPARRPRCEWPFFATLVCANGDIIPCCKFRVGSIYAKHQKRPTMGNLNHAPLAQILNNPAYRISRRLTANPATTPTGAVKANFCHTCPRLFE